jgi:hypothetical protein
MAIETGPKLQKLLATWPNGSILTTAGLKRRGYSDALLYHYRNSGWLVAVGRGAFARAGDVIDWRSGIHALQNQLKLHVHLGGKAALNYQGAAHFLKLGSETVTLFGTAGTRIPSWFASYDWKVRVTLATTNLFPNELGLTSEEAENFALNISSRERAMFETLYLAPKSQSLSEAKLLMAALTNLRPQLLQQLLESCSSIKVKRLFMLFAEELKLPWVKKLEMDRIDFGSGDRTIVKGGKLHSKYRLTMPVDLFDEASR